jgi:UDP-N-acetylglucosamine acyltransferase
MDIPPYVSASGNRARLVGLNLIGLKRRGFREESLKALKKAYRILFQSKEILTRAIETVRQSPEYSCDEVQNLVDFVAGSERGVTR